MTARLSFWCFLCITLCATKIRATTVIITQTVRYTKIIYISGIAVDIVDFISLISVSVHSVKTLLSKPMMVLHVFFFDNKLH